MDGCQMAAFVSEETLGIQQWDSRPKVMSLRGRLDGCDSDIIIPTAYYPPHHAEWGRNIRANMSSCVACSSPVRQRASTHTAKALGSSFGFLILARLPFHSHWGLPVCQVKLLSPQPPTYTERSFSTDEIIVHGPQYTPISIKTYPL